jgi:hypothetical protein
MLDTLTKKLPTRRWRNENVGKFDEWMWMWLTGQGDAKILSTRMSGVVGFAVVAQSRQCVEEYIGEPWNELMLLSRERLNLQNIRRRCLQGKGEKCAEMPSPASADASRPSSQ